MLRESKLAYFENLGSCNQKEFWKVVKLQDSSIPTLTDDAPCLPMTSLFTTLFTLKVR